MKNKTESFIESSSLENKLLRQVAQFWLASKKDTLASTTYTRYLEALERNIYPKYGDTLVSDITDEEIQRFARTIAEKAEKEGKSVTLNMLQMTSGILAMVVKFAREQGKQDVMSEMTSDKREFTWLETAEIERICICAKHNRTPEMLAVMLALFCGIRAGEVCALGWDDVSLKKMQIHVHCSAHRVRADGDSGKKTKIQVEEISTKNQIRTVAVPKEMVDYVGEFYTAGKSVLSGLTDTPADARTLINRVGRIFEAYKIKNVNFQRLHKTYVSGKADTRILQDVFGRKRPSKLYEETLDQKWLTVEMTNDLASLRMLIGLSPAEMGEIVGISETMYQNIERGRRELNWVEYLALLFLFHYNRKTSAVVDALGLYPDSLKEKLGI